MTQAHAEFSHLSSNQILAGSNSHFVRVVHKVKGIFMGSISCFFQLILAISSGRQSNS